MKLKIIKNKYILVFIGIIFISTIWFITTSVTYIQLSSKILGKTLQIENLVNNIVGSETKVTFKDLDQYMKAESTLDSLNIQMISIRTRSSVNFLFHSRTKVLLNNANEIKEIYYSHLEEVVTIKENLSDVFILTNEVKNKIPTVFHDVTNNVSRNSDLSTLREKMESVEGVKNDIQTIKTNILQRIDRTELEAPYDSIQIQIYQSFIEELEFHENQLNGLYTSVDGALQYYQNQQKHISEASQVFYSNSGSINLVYKRLKPITQNLNSQVRPVQQAIQRMESNILPGLSALDLLRRVDPVSAQAISLTRDVTNQISRLDSEINRLIDSIVPLRNASEQYAFNMSRENALKFQRQAKNTTRYLEEKKDVFDPVYENIQKSKEYVQLMNIAINNISNANARNVLLDFTGRTSSFLHKVGQPIEQYRSTVNSTVTTLRQIENLEDQYILKITEISSIEPKVFKRPTSSERSYMAGITAVLSDDYIIVIFIFGGSVFIGLLSFLLIRNKAEEHDEKTSPNPSKKNIKSLNKEKLNNSNNELSDQKKSNIKSVLKRKKTENTDLKSLNSTKTSNEKNSPKKALPDKINEGNTDHSGDFQSFLDSDRENTIIIEKSYRDLNILPGHLLVLNGVQINKKLQLYGCKTQDGIKTTIGRNAPNWKQFVKRDQQKSHIRISDNSMSLSRLQAEIIFKKNNLYIRNLSKSNPTIVNGHSLLGMEKVRLKSGAIITAGYLKVKYIS